MTEASDLPTFDGDRGGIPSTPGELRGNDPYVPVAPDAANPDNVLDMLQADMAEVAEVTRPALRVVLARDPRYVVLLAPTLSGDEIDSANKIAGGEIARQRGQYSTPMYSAAVAAFKCTGIERSGELLRDDRGHPLRFAHRLMMSAMINPNTGRPAATAAECARLFWRDDADLDAAARLVWSESGWAKDAQVSAADPLEGGSPA